MPRTQHPGAARLTLSRPNSQARSSGVFFNLLTRHGLDWCWRSISDWEVGSQVRKPGWPHTGPCLAPCLRVPSGRLTYHLIMPVLCSQVQGDLTIQRGSIDSRRCPQEQSHRLQTALPGCIVERAHTWREEEEIVRGWRLMGIRIGNGTALAGRGGLPTARLASPRFGQGKVLCEAGVRVFTVTATDGGTSGQG